MNERRQIALKGMSWGHPRGYDPLVAAATVWRAERGVDIAWDRRSLQDFEAFPVETLARRYDLMVIDHPHIGEAVATGSLLALDSPERAPACAELRAASVGPSYASYNWGARQWALPIDAAAQVQAFRHDLLAAPPQTWRDVMSLARAGLVDCPMRSPHSLMSLYTLAANLGAACSPDREDFFDAEAGAEAVEQLRELVRLLDPACFDKDPIEVLETMSGADSRIAVSPLIYGYVSYARPGFRGRALKFADIASATGSGPVGSALGGAGIAVSAYCPDPIAASEFAFWIASGPIQRTLYAEAGGQPAHAEAWGDARVNVEAGGFYHDTRETLDKAWLRPRHLGYLGFQHAASDRLNQAFRANESGAHVIAALNQLFRSNVSARVRDVHNDRGSR